MKYILILKLKQGDKEIIVKSDAYDNIKEAQNLAEEIVKNFTSTTDKTITISVQIERN